MTASTTTIRPMPARTSRTRWTIRAATALPTGRTISVSAAVSFAERRAGIHDPIRWAILDLQRQIEDATVFAVDPRKTRWTVVAS